MAKTDLTVANTILEQLGGKIFYAMVGAKHLTGGENFLSMKIGSGTKNKCTHLRVTLEPSDTYKVEFLKCGVKTGIKVLSSHEDIYCDNLRPLFERETGFATSLRRRAR
jgi:hypothetical protein